MKKYISLFATILFSALIMGQPSGAKKVIVKIKDSYRSYCQNDKISIPHFQQLQNSMGITEVKKMFPTIEKPATLTNRRGDTLVDISLIYEFTISTPTDQACKQLSTTHWFEYAEPKNIHEPLHTPNDPYVPSQYYLYNIRAFSGWDISKGDSTIVVGISDTGFDFTHNDMVGAVAYNLNDTIDQIDNDNDGYIDNYQGWDLGRNDNNPQYQTVDHGLFVSGIVAARSNNGIGIAGVGYNTKILPIKTTDINERITCGYESIVYGATHGCAVINCSWGGQISDGRFGEDIVNFATYNCNTLIVAACGNSNNSLPFWPASYRNVISVGSSDFNDLKTTDEHGSTYGWDVDIMAPGGSIRSTAYSNNYLVSNGTSFAAPMVSACAAIVKSHFKQLTPFQVGQRLRVTADLIDTIAANIPFAGKMGKGRLNLYRALTDPDCPAIRYQQPRFSNDIAQTGDTVEFYATFKNFLSTTQNLTITLSLVQGSATLLDTSLHPSPLGTFDNFNNQTEPFRFVIGNNSPNSELVLKITYTDNNYTDFEYLSLYVNQNYINVDTNHIATTFTGNGHLGFADSYLHQGLGFNYLDYNQMFYMGGLIIGKNPTQISDNIYGENEPDTDFENVIPPAKVIPSLIADLEATTTFNDNGAGNMKLNLNVKHQILAWNNPECENFIIHSFTVKNTGTTTQTDLYIGMYNDWDIYLSPYNRVKFDLARRMLYCWCPWGGKYGGIAPLSNQPINRYAFDANNIGLSLNPNDGFTGIEKFTALTTNRDSAGYNGNGNDVSTLLCYRQITLAPGDSITLEFALLAGDNPQSLANSAIKAKEKIHPDDTGIEADNGSKNCATISPNPAANELLVNSTDPMIAIEIYSTSGMQLHTDHACGYKNRYTLNTSFLANGMYIFHIRTMNGVINKKIIINK